MRLALCSVEAEDLDLFPRRQVPQPEIQNTGEATRAVRDGGDLPETANRVRAIVLGGDSKPPILTVFVCEDILVFAPFRLTSRRHRDRRAFACEDFSMSDGQERPWVRIVGSIILGGCGVFAAMVPLYCSKKESLEKQVVQTQTDQTQIEGLRHQIVQLQATIAEKDTEIAKLKERPIPTVPNPCPATTTEGSDKESSAAFATRSVTDHDFVFQLKGCSLSGSVIKCELLITNKESDRKLIIEPSDRSRIIDDAGREYRATFFSLGANSSRGGVLSHLPGGVPIGGQIHYEGVKPGVKRLQLLEIPCIIDDASGRSGAIIQFSHIDL